MSKEKGPKSSKEDKDLAAKSAKELQAEKLAKLKSFKAAMTKKYGIENVSDGVTKKDIEVDTVPSGSISLDVAIGVGGLPFGRTVEIYGPEASGKTTLTLSIISQVQKMGENCVFIDAEQALDVSYAKKLGVQFDETLQIMSPEYGEQALDMVKESVISGAIKCIVVDSVAALVPKKELESEDLSKNEAMGLMARNMSRHLREIIPLAKKYGVLIVYINQTREKIGVMFGNPETTTGGNALKFYASLRLRVRKASGEFKVKVGGEEKVGYKMVVKIVKNKFNSPQEDLELPIVYGVGIFKEYDLFSVAKVLGVIKVEGRTHSVGDTVFGKSAEESLTNLINDEKLLKEVDTQVRKLLKK